jgi:hypothetical protein
MCIRSLSQLIAYMGLLLSNNKHVETEIEWNHGANSNQLYRPEGSLTGGEASPADNTDAGLAKLACDGYFLIHEQTTPTCCHPDVDPAVWLAAIPSEKCEDPIYAEGNAHARDVPLAKVPNKSVVPVSCCDTANFE